MKPVESNDPVREKILSCARKIFSRYGLSKTTVDDIAAEAGMAKSSLYYYYTGKEQLLKAVLDAEVDVVKEQLQEAVDAAETPHRKLRDYVLCRTRHLKRLAGVFNTFRHDYLRHYELIEKIRADYDRYEKEAIGRILRDGVSRGVFRECDLDLSSTAIVTACKGLEYAWALDDDDRQTEHNVDTLLDILFYGIAEGRPAGKARKG